METPKIVEKWLELLRKYAVLPKLTIQPLDDREILLKNLKEWLHPQGMEWFRNIKEKHGTVLATWMEGDIPHPVHFREGMQVRNFLRTQEYCKDWGDHDFDNKWVELIEEVIEK